MNYRVQQIQDWIQGRLANPEQAQSFLEERQVSRIAALGEATENDVAFFFSKEYITELARSNPGILVTAEPFVEPLKLSGLPLWLNTVVLVSPDPYLGMAVLSEKLAPDVSSVVHPVRSVTGVKPDVHFSANVHPSAQLMDGVVVGSHCTLEEGVRVGLGSVIYPGCSIGKSVTIGNNCVIFPHVTLYEFTQIGDRTRIHAGVVIGADGFGYAPRFHDKMPVGHQKIYHTGRVRIGDDVEIGANSCIDRGTFSDTVIGNQVKIDNQVQLGHNVKIGDGSILCGCVGIAGSVTVGKFVTIGGMCGMRNGVHIGDYAKLGGGTMVGKDIPPGAEVLGNPMRSFKEHFRVHAMLNRMIKTRGKENERKS